MVIRYGNVRDSLSLITVLTFALVASPGYGAWGGSSDGWPEGWYEPSKPVAMDGYADLAAHSFPFWWDTSEPGTILAIGLIRFYQGQLSPLRAGHCPMYPSCSRFGLRAVVDYGWLQGSVMIIDRLFFRENAGLYTNYVKARRDGRHVPYDPPHHNNLFRSPDWPLVVRGATPAR